MNKVRKTIYALKFTLPENAKTHITAKDITMQTDMTLHTKKIVLKNLFLINY